MGDSVQKPSGPDSPDRLRWVVLGVLIVAALYFGQTVFKPLALAALLALILTPCVRFLETRGLRRAPAAAATLLVVLGAFGAAGTAVVYQLALLADDLGSYQEALEQKVRALADHEGLLSRAVTGLQRALESAQPLLADSRPDMDVRVVADPLERLWAALAPYLAFAGSAAIVLILLAFFLLRRDDISDRVMTLFGQSRIGLTTRALDEAGGRISRYLSAFAGVNAAYGLAVGLGLWAIGLPLAALWGALAAALRFIPYVGTAAGFLGPVALSVIVFPGWQELLLIVALFAVIEVIVAGGVEPLIYGKSTGVSPVGLLVFALFWTWLWGPLGLLLSTPLTVSLAVAGKYVPGLQGIANMLGDAPGLAPHLRLYQRIVAGDLVAARNMFETALAENAVHAFDSLLVPALAKSRADHAAGHIGAADRDAVSRAVDDFLDEMEWKANVAMTTIHPGREETVRIPATGARAVGIAVGDADDLLTLRMLNVTLAQWDRSMVAIDPHAPDNAVLAWLAECDPAIVVLAAGAPVAADRLRPLVGELAARGHRALVLAGTSFDTERANDAVRPLVLQSLVQARDHVVHSLMSPPELAHRIARLAAAGDFAGADYLYDGALRSRPLDRFCCEIAAPTLAAAETRARDGGDAAAFERVAGYLTGKLRGPVTAVRDATPESARAVVASPGEAVENPYLMMIAVALTARGWDVLYLGNTLSLQDGIAAMSKAHADVVILGDGDFSLVDIALDAARGGATAPVVFSVQRWGAHAREPHAGSLPLPQTLPAALEILEATRTRLGYARAGSATLPLHVT